MSGPFPRQGSLHGLCNNFAGAKLLPGNAVSPVWFRILLGAAFLERHAATLLFSLTATLHGAVKGHGSRAVDAPERRVSFAGQYLFGMDAALGLLDIGAWSCRSESRSPSSASSHVGPWARAPRRR